MHSTEEIPYGYCHCGCGQKTNISQRTDKPDGLVKGHPFHFIRGHSTRLSPVDYVVEDRGYETPCWIWQGSRCQDGYGRTHVNRKTCAAHRLYYERKYGPIPEGLEPDHLCRVRSCVNPDHLEPVTKSVNARRSLNAKLRIEDVMEIRRIGNSVTQVMLAERFNVSPSLIGSILRREKWRDVADDSILSASGLPQPAVRRGDG